MTVGLWGWGFPTDILQGSPSAYVVGVCFGFPAQNLAGPLCGDSEVKLLRGSAGRAGPVGAKGRLLPEQPRPARGCGSRSACTPCLGLLRTSRGSGIGAISVGKGVSGRGPRAPEGRGGRATGAAGGQARERGRDAEAMGGGARSPDVRAGRRQDVLLHRDLLAVEDQMRVAETRLLPERAERPQQARGVLRVGHSAALGHRAFRFSAATRPARPPESRARPRRPLLASACPPARTE